MSGWVGLGLGMVAAHSYVMSGWVGLGLGMVVAHSYVMSGWVGSQHGTDSEAETVHRRTAELTRFHPGRFSCHWNPTQLRTVT